MRWPDIFFKSRKSKSLSEIVTVPAKPAEPARGAPEKTEIERVATVNAEKEKMESLRALAESGKVSVGARAEKESPLATTKLAENDSSNAKTTVLPAVQPRGSGVSLRQRAKLTEDARLLPKEEPPILDPEPEASKPAPDAPSSAESLEAKPPEPSKTESAAVVPAAFPVPVETGTLLEKPEEKLPEKTMDAPTVESKPPAEKPSSEPIHAHDDSPSGAPTSVRETARVHIAHTTTSGKPSATLEAIKPDTREKSEFVLANGERIFGHILSETPQTIYLDHGTLGVLTLPRSQIAAKPIEVILINGDRIVGDLIAETPECLYIKHASLGMVTVPQSQRSTRVVEAILKDGDRILGEVLAETDNFTVIRSATLGTVAVQHDQVAMLNRKIEQMQLRALPIAGKPALEDKKD